MHEQCISKFKWMFGIANKKESGNKANKIYRKNKNKNNA